MKGNFITTALFAVSFLAAVPASAKERLFVMGDFGAVPESEQSLVRLLVYSNEYDSASPRLRVRIPLADGNPDSRVYAYEVVVVGDEGTTKLHKAVYAAGCNMGIGHEPNGGVTTLEIPKSELPPGKTLTFAVRPLTSLGTAGKPIAAMFSA